MLDLDNIDNNFEELYDLFFLDVYKFLISFTGNLNDAEDLTHEVFIKVLKSASKFNNQCTLKTWILSIAKHTAIDFHRRKKFTSLFNDNFFNSIRSNEKTPEDFVEINEQRRMLKDVLNSLKPQHRAIVILRGINDLSIKETAQVLGFSESKVKVEYHRAIKLIKEKVRLPLEEVFESEK
nr:sigma-70 family RNA polymerase sigma factor [Fredinandcohnia onubensis]